MKEKFTPGPWKIRQCLGSDTNDIVGTEAIHTNGMQRNSLGISSASYSEVVCEINGWLDLDGPRANAHLIAAAPEMYQIISELVVFAKGELKDIGGCDHSVGICCCGVYSMIDRAEEILEKARGES